MYDSGPMHAPASKRRLAAMALVAVLFVHLSALWTTRAQILAGRPDFSSFYAAGKLVITGNGQSLYNLDAQSRAQEEFRHGEADRAGTLPFGHPPFELLVFAPFAALPYAIAFALWYLANLGLLLGSIFVLRDHVPLIRDRFALVLVIVGCFYPAVVTIVQGQDSILLLFLFALFYVRLKERHDLGAGLVLALCTFKFQLVFPALVAVSAARRWKALQGFTAGCAGLVILSIPIVGLKGLLDYPRFLVEYANLPPEVAAVYPDQMPNLRGVLALVPVTNLRPALFALIFVVLMVALAFVFSRVRRSSEALQLAYAACVSVIVFVSYHLNVHDVVLMILPLLMAADSLRKKLANSPLRILMMTTVVVVYFAPALSGIYRVLITAGSIFLFTLLLVRESLLQAREVPTGDSAPTTFAAEALYGDADEKTIAATRDYAAPEQLRSDPNIRSCK